MSPTYRYSLPCLDTRGLDPKRYTVSIVVGRRDDSDDGLTAADIAAIEAVYAPELATKPAPPKPPTRTKTKTAPKPSRAAKVARAPSPKRRAG